MTPSSSSLPMAPPRAGRVTSFAFAPTSPQRHAPSQGVPVPRVSPRQVKLQRVEPPAYALRLTLRDHVAANFHHELFQFHQTLRDAYDRSVLELLTSDRGDAVLKEFFRQWQQKKSGRGAIADEFDQEDSCSDDSADVLWDVLETFFKSVPLVLPDSEVSNAKSYFRYLDALRSLRDVLLALLYKKPGKADDEEDSDDDESGGSSSFSFLLANTPSTSLSSPVKGVSAEQRTQQRARLQPMHVYCQQLERELSKLRERHPNRTRIAGFRASLKHSERQDVGLLNDTTVLMLLDFWELPRIERLGFFCQIASQARDEDAMMLLRVFLDNCSTRNFLHIWDSLQQAPQFESTFAAAARQYCAALREGEGKGEGESGAGVDSSTATVPGSDEGSTKSKSKAVERVRERRATRSSRHRVSVKGDHHHQRHRTSRLVDLSGLTEVFEERDDDSPMGSDSSSSSDGGGRQFNKILIHERGRTPLDERHDTGNRVHRRRRHQHNNHPDDRRQLPPVSSEDQSPLQQQQSQLPPANPHMPLLRRLHDILVELIKQDELSETTGSGRPPASPQVMDTVWKLLEVLDKGKQLLSSSLRRQSSRSASTSSGGTSGFHRIDSTVDSSLHGSSRSSASLLQDPLQHRQTLLLDANLSRDQQFAIKLDQLQSLLTALGAFSLHEMATETISSAYRRMPALVKLFSGVHEKTFEAAGVEAASDAKLNLIVGATAQQQHRSSVLSTAGRLRSVSTVPGAALAPPVSLSSSDDQVIEAASVLMSKVSKIVRSLANLDQLSAGGREGGGNSNDGEGKANLDVLAILKLADDMESGGIESHDTDAQSSAESGGGRRGSLIDHSRRLAILHKLKALAMSSEIDAIAGMVSETVKDAREQQVQQLQQIDKLSSSSGSGKQRRRRASRMEGVVDSEPFDDGDGDSDDDDGADEVFRMAKKAKTRRASEAAAAAKAQQQSSQLVDSDDSDDGSSKPQAPSGRRDVLLNFRQASAAQKGVKLFSVGILLRIIYQIYRESYEGMVSSPQYGSRRMGFSEFLYDWHIRKYGLKALAQQHLFKLIQSLRKFERKAFQCQLCLRFLGIQSPLGFHEHKFVLSLLDKWSLGTFSGTTKHRVEHSTRQFKIRIPFAIATLQDALGERFGVYFRSMDALAARIRSQAMTTPGDEEFVKESDVLRVAIDEWVLQRQRLEQILEAVYVAGDLNGDGGLEFDEFAAVVAHLSPVVDDKLLLKVFAAAHDIVKPPRRISFARFIDVILLERILNTSAAVTSSGSRVSGSGAASSNATAASKPGLLGDDNTSGSSNTRGAGSNARSYAAGAATSKTASALASQEDEETLQFNLLQQMWEHDRDVVERALRLITHQPTAASLTFRVSFLTQIIAKRVDSKTAWLCHKQIMRDISRYQNLDEEQIVVLKKKEETFRKAVLAITNLRRLGALLGGDSRVALKGDGDADADATTAFNAESNPLNGEQHQEHQYQSDQGEELDETTQDECRYTAAVERKLEGLQRSGSLPGDMLALEDELRERFLASADEGAIEDFKVAVQQLRRISRFSASDGKGGSFALGISLEQFEALHAPPGSEAGGVGRVEEGDEDDEEDEELEEGEEEGEVPDDAE